MSSLRFARVIRDPIWGDIPITGTEEKVIQTRAFRRLRHIKQMSLAYLGHQGAQHTRFEHSIGCCHVASMLASSLTAMGDETSAALRDIDTTIGDPEVLKHVRLAGLLHDVGHAPMSHLVESVFYKYPHLLEECIKSKSFAELPTSDQAALQDYGHEQFSIRIIENDDELQSVLAEVNIQVDALKYLINGKGDYIATKFRIYKPLISGDLDADRLDYINRDFYFCGVRETIDLQLFARSLRLYCRSKGVTPEIVIDDSSVIPASSFLFSRMRLVDAIHNASDTRVNEQAFIQLIRNYFEHLTPDERVRALLRLHTVDTDLDLMTELADSAVVNAGDGILLKARDLMDGRATELMDVFLQIPPDRLHPLEMYCVNLIASNPAIMRKLEDRIRDDVFKDAFFILDLISSKPSVMTLPVHKHGMIRSLFDGYHLPHAIFAASVRSTTLRILVRADADLPPISYEKRLFELGRLGLHEMVRRLEAGTSPSPEEKARLELEANIKDMVISVALDELQSLGRDVPMEILVLLVLYYIRKHAEDKLGHDATLWTKSDTNLHRFVRAVASDVQLTPGFERENGFDHELYKATERLVYWGLIDHIHKPVPYYDQSSVRDLFVSRVDRMINQWGEAFIEELEKRLDTSLTQGVRKAVFGRQGAVEGLLAQYREKQLGSRGGGKQVHDDLHGINVKIRKAEGCVLKFI